LFKNELKQRQEEHSLMDGADDWIEVAGMRRWLASCDEWEEEQMKTALITPYDQQRLYLGKWVTKVPTGVQRRISQHSYRQLSGKVPRYRQHTIASLMKQRMVA
jgi:hypothetical protein